MNDGRNDSGNGYHTARSAPEDANYHGVGSTGPVDGRESGANGAFANADEFDGGTEVIDNELVPVEPDWTKRWRHEAAVGFNSRGWQLGREDASSGQGTESAEVAIKAAVDYYWYRRLTRARQAIGAKHCEIEAQLAEKSALTEKVQSIRDMRACLGSQPDLPPPKGRQLAARLYIAAGALAIGAEFSLAAAMVIDGIGKPGIGLKHVGVAADFALVATLCLLLGFAAKLLLDGIQTEATERPMGRPTAAVQLARRWRVVFRVAEFALLLACGFTVWSAAGLRTAVDRRSSLEKEVGALEEQVEKETKRQTMRALLLPSTGGSGQANGAEYPVDLQSRKDDLAEKQVQLREVEATREELAGTTLRRLAFTAPLFAAMCLFTGMRNLGARSEDERIYAQQEAAVVRIAELEGKLLKARKAEVRAQRRLADDLEHEAAIKAARFAAELAFYQHGYSRGRAWPVERPTDNGVYDLHVQALKRLGRRRILNHYARKTKGEEGV